MSLQNLINYPRIELLGAPTPLEHLPRLSEHLGRDIFIKRDDLTPVALGGNKLRKLEFLVADALRQGADVLVTAGAIQSNHVRQTAAVASRLGLKCVALLENAPGLETANYLNNGNRFLLELMDTEVIPVAALSDPAVQLDEQATRLEAQGFRPYVVPVGGSNALGSLGYVECAQEIAHQSEGVVDFAAVVVASGSAGTQAGLAVGLEHLLPDTELVGVTVSRQATEQQIKVESLRQAVAASLSLSCQAPVTLWDEYVASGYGVPSEEGMEAVKLPARLEGIFLDPVYTGKAMAGLIEGIEQDRFRRPGPIVFVHTGGSPALFAYHPL